MTSLTPAGQARQADKDQAMAVNELFGLFRVNYHNQYYKAFPDTETLNTTKKLWLASLLQFPAGQISRAGEQIIKTSEYLPTLAQMLRACASCATGKNLPDVRSAFMEACNAPSPKVSHQWSHPAVYWAGRAAGWHRLATTDESRSFPLFQQQYEHQLTRLMNGEQLPAIEQQKDSDEAKPEPLDREVAKQKLAELRKLLD